MTKFIKENGKSKFELPEAAAPTDKAEDAPKGDEKKDEL